MKQCDLCILALTEKGGWCRAYELEKYTIAGETVGSEADTRLYEVFSKKVIDADFKSTEKVIKDSTYTIETKKTGGERWWRASLTAMKPKHKMYYVRHPITGKMITSEEYALL